MAWFSVSRKMSLEDSMAVEWAKRAFSRRSLQVFCVARFFYLSFNTRTHTSRSSCFTPWLARENVFSILRRRFWYSRSISFTPWLIFCFTSRRRIWISCSPSTSLLWYRSSTWDRIRAALSGGSSQCYSTTNTHSSTLYPALLPSVLPWQNTLNDSPNWQMIPNLTSSSFSHRSKCSAKLFSTAVTWHSYQSYLSLFNHQYFQLFQLLLLILFTLFQFTHCCTIIETYLTGTQIHTSSVHLITQCCFFTLTDGLLKNHGYSFLFLNSLIIQYTGREQSSFYSGHHNHQLRTLFHILSFIADSLTHFDRNGLIVRWG